MLELRAAIVPLRYLCIRNSCVQLMVFVSDLPRDRLPCCSPGMESNGAGKTALMMAPLWALTGSIDTRSEVSCPPLVI